MKHLIRAGGLLIAVLILSLVIPRVMPIPESLHEYGFYPKSNAEDTQVWANQPVKYSSVAECQSCHKENFVKWRQSQHATTSCENCHGPGIPHIEEGDSMIIETSRDSCGTCHDTVIARPEGFPQVNLEEHNSGISCTSCHNPHFPEEMLGIKISHSLDGRDDCLQCHGESGFQPFPDNHTDRGTETCLNCHQVE